MVYSLGNQISFEMYKTNIKKTITIQATWTYSKNVISLQKYKRYNLENSW